MNEKTDVIQVLFNDDENQHRDDGFSDGVVARLNRRWWIRICVLVAASTLGLTLFIFHFLKIAPLIQTKIDPGSMAVRESVMALLTTNVSALLQIAMVAYVLSATLVMVIQSMNRIDRVR